MWSVTSGAKTHKRKINRLDTSMRRFREDDELTAAAAAANKKRKFRVFFLCCNLCKGAAVIHLKTVETIMLIFFPRHDDLKTLH